MFFFLVFFHLPQKERTREPKTVRSNGVVCRMDNVYELGLYLVQVCDLHVRSPALSPIDWVRRIKEMSHILFHSLSLVDSLLNTVMWGTIWRKYVNVNGSILNNPQGGTNRKKGHYEGEELMGLCFGTSSEKATSQSCATLSSRLYIIFVLQVFNANSLY